MSNNTNAWVELEVAELDEVQGGFSVKHDGHISIDLKGTGPLGGQASIGIDIKGGIDVTVTP